jgi:hypothetical protein
MNYKRTKLKGSIPGLFKAFILLNKIKVDGKRGQFYPLKKFISDRAFW